MGLVITGKSVKNGIKEVKVDYDWIIRVELQDGDPRVCDYCNKLLVDEEGLTVEQCHSTDYGLMCRSCLGRIKPISSHEAGVNVKQESWYKGI